MVRGHWSETDTESPEGRQAKTETQTDRQSELQTGRERERWGEGREEEMERNRMHSGDPQSSRWAEMDYRDRTQERETETGIKKAGRQSMSKQTRTDRKRERGMDRLEDSQSGK